MRQVFRRFFCSDSNQIWDLKEFCKFCILEFHACQWLEISYFQNAQLMLAGYLISSKFQFLFCIVQFLLLQAKLSTSHLYQSSVALIPLNLLVLFAQINHYLNYDNRCCYLCSLQNSYHYLFIIVWMICCKLKIISQYFTGNAGFVLLIRHVNRQLILQTINQIEIQVSICCTMLVGIKF